MCASQLGSSKDYTKTAFPVESDYFWVMERQQIFSQFNSFVVDELKVELANAPFNKISLKIFLFKSGLKECI